MALQHVGKGDKFVPSATAHNAFVDAALAHQRALTSTDGTGNIAPRDRGLVTLKNVTVSDRSRFDVMALSDPLIGPADSLVQFLSNLCWQGIAPNSTTHIARWGVLQQPLVAGQIGNAIVAGVTPALIDINDADDTHVEAATGDYRLQSGTTGSARILWKESGTGADKWAVIRIGDVAAAGGAGAEPYRIKEVFDNHLRCRTWDGTTDGGTDVLIAKPFQLRHVTANYPWIDAASLATVNAQEVTVEVSAVEYTWRVTLPYAVNEVIWASPTTLGDVVISAVPLTLEDTNRAGHAWGVYTP